MKIAYLGPRGSFCSVVAETAFVSEELFAYDSILDVIEAYDEGNVILLLFLLKIRLKEL